MSDRRFAPYTLHEVISELRWVLPQEPELTMRQVHLLVVVPRMQAEYGMSVKDLAPVLGVAKPVVTRNVGTMIKHGLLTKTRNGGDERLVEIKRTELGDTIAVGLDCMINAMVTRDRNSLYEHSPHLPNLERLSVHRIRP
jgi:DNA-binding MarR family transcriptional regulator